MKKQYTLECVKNRKNHNGFSDFVYKHLSS